MIIEFKFSLHPLAKRLGGRIPDCKHPGEDAGYDVYPLNLGGTIDMETKWPAFPYTLQPGEVVAIPTGLTFVPPEGWFVEVIAKTGRSMQGIIPAAVVFDRGYRPDPRDAAGSVMSVRNTSNEPFVLTEDKSFAQLVLRPLCPAVAVEVEHGTIGLDTARGQKRYGTADGEGDIMLDHVSK